MPTLIIRDVPAALNTLLAKRARKNRRSKEKEALHMLEQLTGGTEVDWSAFLDQPRRKIARDFSNDVRKASR